jgi:uncharacterized membrane protein YczE
VSPKSRLALRIAALGGGLFLFGVSIGLMVRADLGLGPWDVLHQGIAERTGISMGWVVNGTAVIVLLAWIPIRERPGIGTLCNVLLIGPFVDLTLAVLPEQTNLAVRIALLAAGIVGLAAATGLYVGAGFGPGPRDGLMTGLAKRGHSIRVVRTAIEVAVLVIGWLLGGTVGIGTLLFALTIGPLVHLLAPRLAIVPIGSPNPARKKA